VAQICLGLGQSLVGQGNLEEAQAHYGRVLRLIQTDIGTDRGILKQTMIALNELMANWQGPMLEHILAIKLMGICMESDRNKLRQFHQQYPNMCEWEDLSGFTALQWAAFTGEPQFVKELLALGADWRAGASRTMTAMDVAVSYNHYYVIKALTEAGADFNTPGLDGMTPIHWAARKNRELSIDKLIAKGVDWNKKDKKGRTPLHLAAMLGHLDTAIALIEQSVPLNVADSTGQTPLHIAAGKGNLELVVALLTGGADPSLTEAKQKLTPQMMAERLGHKAVVDALKHYSKLFHG
jgi:hypothetical protein